MSLRPRFLQFPEVTNEQIKAEPGAVQVSWWGGDQTGPDDLGLRSAYKNDNSCHYRKRNLEQHKKEKSGSPWSSWMLEGHLLDSGHCLPRLDRGLEFQEPVQLVNTKCPPPRAESPLSAAHLDHHVAKMRVWCLIKDSRVDQRGSQRRGRRCLGFVGLLCVASACSAHLCVGSLQVLWLHPMVLKRTCKAEKLAVLGFSHSLSRRRSCELFVSQQRVPCLLTMIAGSVPATNLGHRLQTSRV